MRCMRSLLDWRISKDVVTETKKIQEKNPREPVPVLNPIQSWQLIILPGCRGNEVKLLVGS